MTWRISGATLWLEDGRSIEFAAPVRQAIEVDETIVVRIQYYRSPTENVFGVRDAKVVWDTSARPEASGAYTELSLARSKVRSSIFDSNCYRYRIDTTTGAVLASDFTK